jgi:hypothetical protein
MNMETTMKERPILFSAPMVRALLASQKTQTRRIVKPQPSQSSDTAFLGADGIWRFSHLTLRGPVSHEADDVRCPYGQPGDRLYVRETWCCVHGIPEAGSVPHPDDFVRYRADAGPGEKVIDDVKGWKPSIHMPRVYSRILLEVVSVRVERLQDISRGDAMDEGCPFPNMAQGDDPRKWYAQLWESINGAGSWDLNPWVWCVSFRRIEA